MPQDSFDYVIVGAGSAGAVLAARLTRGPGTTRAAPRGRRRGRCRRGQHPGGVPDAVQDPVGLELHHHRAEAAARPPGLLAADEGARRVLVDERDDLHPRATAPTTTPGATSTAPPAGATTTSCRTSRRRRATPAWAARSTARTGPLHVEDRSYTHELSHAFVDSAVAAGLKPHRRLQRRRAGGGRALPGDLQGRPSLVDQRGLPAPARGRPNLTVTTGALATRVELDGDRATGVTFRQGGRRAHRPGATRGAALRRRDQQPAAADALGHRAGQPPRRGRDHLRVDLSGVGANLQDHPVVPMLWHTRGTTDLAQLNSVRNFARWKARGTGPLVLERRRGRRVLRQPRRSGRPRHPDPRRAVRLLRQRHPRADQPDVHRRPDPGVGAEPRLDPAALGRPAWHPAIEAAYLEDQTDLDALLAGARRTWEICTQGALAAVPRPAVEPADAPVRRRPARAHPDLGADALPPGLDLRDGLRRGRRGRRRSLGSAGSRACASSTPRSCPPYPRGNTNAPTIMVAEKAADEIRKSTMTQHRDRTRAPATTFDVAEPRHRRRRRHPPDPHRRRRSARRSSGPASEAAWWSALSFDERETHLTAWKGVMTRRLAQLADMMHLETGKPHGDAMLEASLADRPPGLGGRQRRQGARAAQGAGGPADGQPGRDRGVRPARRRRRDRPVELPGLHPDGLDRLRAGRGQRRRLQAQRVHPRRRRVAGPDLPRGRRAPGAPGRHRPR